MVTMTFDFLNLADILRGYKKIETAVFWDHSESPDFSEENIKTLSCWHKWIVSPETLRDGRMVWIFFSPSFYREDGRTNDRYDIYPRSAEEDVVAIRNIIVTNKFNSRFWGVEWSESKTNPSDERSV